MAGFNDMYYDYEEARDNIEAARRTLKPHRRVDELDNILTDLNDEMQDLARKADDEYNREMAALTREYYRGVLA